MESKCETCSGFGVIDSESDGYGEDFENCPDCREVIDGVLVKKCLKDASHNESNLYDYFNE